MAEAAQASLPTEEPTLDSEGQISTEDLPILLDLLYNAISKWELIATYLKLSGGAIAIIKSRQESPENQLLEVLRRWLSNVQPAPTVMSLVEVLKKPIIGEEKIALEIAKHYFPNSHLSLKKSVSTSDAETTALLTSQPGLDRSESSPATVSHPTIFKHKYQSTQVSIPGAENIPKPESITGPESIPDSGKQKSNDNLDATDIESKSPYRYLNVKEMTELDQRNLKGRLTNEYFHITSSHSKLIQHVIQSLNDQNVTPKKLCTVLMNLNAFPVQKHTTAPKPLLADNLDKIREAEDVDEVFFILHSYGSFFDCHVIRHIVNSKLCTDEDRKELKKYEDELTSYCQRTIFECPHIESLDPKFHSFVMKVDDIVLDSLEMKAIDAFRVDLAKALGLEPHTLHLCSVEKGCVQLTFQIPPCVVDLVSPLSTEQQFALKKLGVLTLNCGDYVFDFSEIKTTGCAWHKLLGRCTWGEECRYEHDVSRITNPSVDNFPDFATPEAVKQIPPSGYTPEGKAYIYAISPNEAMKIIAEDGQTLEFAKVELRKRLQSTKPDHQNTRLKYSYIHPDGIEQPVLYVFKKQYQGGKERFQLEPVKPKEAVKRRTVEDFEHLPNKHVTDAYSRLFRHKKNVYPIQLRRDYSEDILEQLKQGLKWMHENGLTPRIEGRYGKISWRECIEDECFDVETLVSLTKEGDKLKYFTFNTEVETADAVAMKDSHKQIGIKEDTYTLIVKDKSGSSESYRVKIKFEGNEKPTIIYVRKLVAGIAKVQVLFDVLLLHRQYDIRLSLSSIEKVDDPDVKHFITSTIKMPHPGVIHYDPTVSQSTWYVSYIRSQESETFHLKGSYSFEISAIGQYEIDQSMGDKEYKILPEDFRRRHEIELHCKSLTLDPNALFHDREQNWDPDRVIEDFKNEGFLQTMEDLNKEMHEFNVSGTHSAEPL